MHISYRLCFFKPVLRESELFWNLKASGLFQTWQIGSLRKSSIKHQGVAGILCLKLLSSQTHEASTYLPAWKFLHIHVISYYKVFRGFPHLGSKCFFSNYDAELFFLLALALRFKCSGWYQIWMNSYHVQLNWIKLLNKKIREHSLRPKGDSVRWQRNQGR